MNLVLFAEQELVRAEGELRVVVRDRRARHLREVLRLSVGDRVRVGVLDGAVGEARIAAIDEHTATLVIEALELVPPRSRVDLLLCLPRPKVLARLLSPIAQLGVARLLLSSAHRVERYYFDATILEPGALGERLVEGLEQARDTRLPEVSVHRSFAWLVRTELGPAREDELRLYADVGETRSIRGAIERWPGRARGRVLLAIGPEGGFTDRERRELEAASFVRVGLGDRALRSDVAVILLLGLVHAALAELG